MIWKIIDKDQDSIDIIDDLVTREIELSHRLSDDMQQAWSRIQELAKKGQVAEKYAKEWSENAKDLS
tara:strand:- start:622 stop:822 length:201 start_codon:yes stop_codon:yes gene_type:complete